MKVLPIATLPDRTYFEGLVEGLIIVALGLHLVTVNGWSATYIHTMFPQRAGLNNTFSRGFTPLRMTTTAVLFLVISLSAITAQAAPVTTLSMTSPGSEVTANVGSSHSPAACISPNKPHQAAQTNSELTAPCTSSSPHHHMAPISTVQTSQPIEADQMKPVALERRRSLFSKLKSSVKVSILYSWAINYHINTQC